jgi:hypothetical protein
MNTDNLLYKTTVDGRRKAFVQAVNRTEVLKRCPWALYIARVENGFRCFENKEDYFEFKKELQK